MVALAAWWHVFFKSGCVLLFLLLWCGAVRCGVAVQECCSNAAVLLWCCCGAAVELLLCISSHCQLVFSRVFPRESRNFLGIFIIFVLNLAYTVRISAVEYCGVRSKTLPNRSRPWYLGLMPRSSDELKLGSFIFLCYCRGSRASLLRFAGWPWRL